MLWSSGTHSVLRMSQNVLVGRFHWRLRGTLSEMCFDKCWPSAQVLNQAATTPPATTQPTIQRNFTVTAGKHPIHVPFLFWNTQTTFFPSPVISYSPFFSNNYSIFLYRNIFRGKTTGTGCSLGVCMCVCVRMCVCTCVCEQQGHT